MKINELVELLGPMLIGMIKRDLMHVNYVYLKQNAYSEVHERFCEIYNTFSGVVDGH